MVLSLQLRTPFTVVSFCTHALRLSAIPVPLYMVGFQFMHQFEKVFLWKLWRYDLICGMFEHIRLLNRSLECMQ